MQNENSNLATNVCLSRKRLGLSQEALAEKANISLSTVQRIEKGTVKPRAFTLKILAETLELEISDLISKPDKVQNFQTNFYSLKKINFTTFYFFFIPFINLIVPLIIWRKGKQIQPKNIIAGKMISFQLLWSIATIIGMGITLFLSNLLIGKPGNGLFITILFYLFTLIFNIFIIVKTASQLNDEDEKVLSFVPNLF